MTDPAAPTPTPTPTPDTSSDAPDSSQDMVEIPYASDAELDAALESELAKEGGYELPSDEEDSSDEDDATKDATDDAADEDQASAPDSKVDSDEVKDLKKQLNKKNQEVRDAQEFISRTNQRYGDLKKQLLQEIAGIESNLDEMSQAEAVQAGLKLDRLKAKAQQIEGEEATFNHVVKTKEIVERIIPEEEFNVEAMAEELASDDGDPEYIAAFKKNPFAVAQAHEIIMLHKATKYKNGMMVLATALKNAKAENEKLRAKPNQVLKKIDQVSKNSVGVTGKNGGGSKEKSIRNLSESDIAKLSEKELNEALEAAIRAEG